jgi:hypothetical protein
MAITSQDALMTSLTGGKFWRADWNKNWLAASAMTAGQWYYLGFGNGNPATDALIGSGTNLAHVGISDTTTTTATTAALGGSIATTTFTDTTHSTGRFTVGMLLSGSGVTAGTYITALGTGTGANNTGTYTVNISQTVTAQTITGTASPNGIYHGGNVSTDVKNLLNASVFSAAVTTAPAVYMLVDVLAQYTVSSVTTTGAQNFTGSAAWPRYADGKGVQAFVVPSIVMGVGTPTITLGYSNTTPTSGRFTPATPVLPTSTASAVAGSIPYSGTGAGKVGPFLPLQAGDAGISAVASINLSATHTSGCLNVVICRPLATLPVTTVGVASERDLVNMLPSMPRIYDGANLQWLMYAGAATPVNSAIYGSLDFAWG